MTMNVETIQSGKGQDFGICGIGFDVGTGARFEYGIVADGHGDDRYINGVRSTTAAEFSTLIASSSPIDSIIVHLNSKCVLSYNSGCTFVLVKIYKVYSLNSLLFGINSALNLPLFAIIILEL